MIICLVSFTKKEYGLAVHLDINEMFSANI